MKYGIIITFATLLLMGACRQKGTENEAKTNNQSAETTETRQLNIIKKRISTPFDFTHITNLGSVDIIYTQGDYAIEAEGDSATLNYLITDFDSNVLTVSLQTDNNTDINKYGNKNNIKMYVSAPTLKCVGVCGNGSFESRGTWKADDIQLGVISIGSMKIDKVECTTFDLQSTDIGNISISDLHADDARLYSRSSANIDVNMDVKNLIVINEGTQKMKLTGKALHAKIKYPGDENLTNELSH